MCQRLLNMHWIGKIFFQKKGPAMCRRWKGEKPSYVILCWFRVQVFHRSAKLNYDFETLLHKRSLLVCFLHPLSYEWYLVRSKYIGKPNMHKFFYGTYLFCSCSYNDVLFVAIVIQISNTGIRDIYRTFSAFDPLLNKFDV